MPLSPIGAFESTDYKSHSRCSPLLVAVVVPSALSMPGFVSFEGWLDAIQKGACGGSLWRTRIRRNYWALAPNPVAWWYRPCGPMPPCVAGPNSLCQYRTNESLGQKYVFRRRLTLSGCLYCKVRYRMKTAGGTECSRNCKHPGPVPKVGQAVEVVSL